jgi:hydrogenase expression/formation protein HypC
MCVAIPMRVVEINGNEAVCEYEGIKRTARIDLLPEVKVGDYVLIHVGFVIQKIDIDSAEKTLKLYKQMQEML